MRALGWTLVIPLALGVLLRPVGAEPDPETRIVGAFLYNFTKVTHWPEATASDSLCIIGVVGADPAALALDTIEGKTVDGAMLSTRRVDSLEEATACRILYFAPAAVDELGSYLEHVADAPVLTVAGISGFGEQGGIIELVRRRNRLSLRINLEAASRAQLRFSSQLLKMAEIYEGKA